MKSTLVILFIALINLHVKGQYYYKDLVLSGQTSVQLSNLKAQKVKSIKLFSFEYTNEPTEGFEGEQTLNNNYTFVTTHTKSPVLGESILKTYYGTDGKLLNTLDTTDGASSATTYQYDENKRVTNITNISISGGQSKEKEQHLWYYTPDGKVERMVKIKNDKDTTHFSFVLDEMGNVAEEKAVRKGVAQGTIYYYYNDNNQLTDIVRFNQKARRLLPDFVFEYDENNRLSSMLVVPEGSDEYLKWYYTYDNKGLKAKEACFNKRKQLLGRIEYQYKF